MYSLQGLSAKPFTGIGGNKMKDMVKKYMPYAVVIFAIYLIAPLLFRSPATTTFVGVVWYFIFPATAIASSAVFCSKYGLDFLFSLIAPICFFPAMFLYYGGINFVNILLLIVYLIAGIFGLFVGDVALGDKRRAQEKAEKEKAEEMMLEAKRRDERENEKLKQRSSQSEWDDDFDYDRYLSDIDKAPFESNEAEIDDILNEYRHNI